MDEFDTHLPHWFGNADPQPIEFLSTLAPETNASTSSAHYDRS